MPIQSARHALVHAGCDVAEDALQTGGEVVQIERRRIEEEILVGGVLAARLDGSLGALHHPAEFGKVLADAAGEDGVAADHSGAPSRSMTSNKPAEHAATSSSVTAIS